MLIHGPTSKTNHKLVKTHSALIWCWDKSRATLDSLDSSRPGLEGSHHLPPYSIFCVIPWEPHSNGTFSRDSQGGVPKLSWVGLSGLWELVSLGSNLRLEWSLNQSCNFPRELSNALSHSFCKRREKVDSRLLVVKSQIAHLTLDPSFAHNLGCRCPNGSCEAILDIYTSRPFHWYKEHFNARCFNPCNQVLNFQESRRTPSPPTHSQLLEGLKCESKWKAAEERGVGTRSLVHHTLKGRGACWSSGVGLGRVDKLIHSHEPAHNPHKVVSA
jgi:hypothetical protein